MPQQIHSGEFHLRWNTANTDNDPKIAWRLIPVVDGVEQPFILVAGVNFNTPTPMRSIVSTNLFVLDGVLKGNIRIVGDVVRDIESNHCQVQ